MNAPDRYARIRAVVRDIPRGRVASYGQVAELAGIARGARQVGYALNRLPPDSDVPWHRVVNAAGRISLPDAGGAAAEQTARLRAEGVRVARRRIDLERYGWRPDLDELLWKPRGLDEAGER